MVTYLVYYASEAQRAANFLSRPGDDAKREHGERFKADP